MNVPQEEIERINLESLKHKSIEGLLGERQELLTSYKILSLKIGFTSRYTTIE
jgi:hypothetical protein